MNCRGETMQFKLEEFVRKHRKSAQCTGKAKPCTDHLGNKFDSYTDMCNYHGVDFKIFYYRKNKLRLSIEKCLAPVKIKHKYSKKL